MARPQGYRPRLIWPSFFTCEQLADQDSRVRLLFISLFAHCFDWGKQRFTPGKLQGNTWFYRSHPDAMTEEEIEQSLQLFMDRGLLELHEFEELRYYLLPTWDERQPIRDRAADLYPQLTQSTMSLPPVNPGFTPGKHGVSSLGEERREEKRREEKRKERGVGKTDKTPPAFTSERLNVSPQKWGELLTEGFTRAQLEQEARKCNNNLLQRGKTTKRSDATFANWMHSQYQSEKPNASTTDGTEYDHLIQHSGTGEPCET